MYNRGMENNKVCKKCGKEKENDIFKTCRREYATKWRKKNPELIRAQRRRWYTRHPDIAKKNSEKWRRNNLEKSNAYSRNLMREWASENREKANQRVQQWREKHPQKWYEIRMRHHYKNMDAYNCQWRGLKAFPEQQTCEIEGCFVLGERHHDDYNKPLEIRWLCRNHHKEYHRLLCNI